MLCRHAARGAGAHPRLLSRTPAALTHGLGRYEIPVYRLGRLAVDRSVQGRGLGGRLLRRATERCMTVAQEVGGVLS